MTTRPPQTKPSTPRLSDRAKVVYPSGIVRSGWPEVERQHRKLGIRFDWWQVAISRLALAKRADGTYAATVGGVVLSIPRQVGKTFMLCGLLFALCLVTPGTTALWTAQQLRTAKETLRAMQGFARRKAIKPFVAYVRMANGEGEVGFVNGSRILFGARDYGFGLGMAEIDILVFDEGQRLRDTALDDMLPTQNRAPNPLFFIVGTPPRPTDDGQVFTRKRKEALAGDSDDLVYVEFSADRDTTPRDRIDWEQVGRGNPSFPEHTPRTAILRMWKNLGAESFWREGYGIWDNDGAIPSTIGKAEWSDLGADAPPTTGHVALGIKFSLDGKRVALAAARKPDDGLAHVEVLGVWPMAEGLAAVTAYITASWRSLSAVVIDGKAGRELLHSELVRARAARMVILPTVDQVTAAHTTFLTAVQDSTLTHANQPGLNGSVQTATQRKIGTLGGWGWAPIGDGDVLPIEAATLALWGVVTSKKRAGAGTAPKRIM